MKTFPRSGGRALLRLFATATLACTLGACAHPDFLRTGMTRAELDARFGPPAAQRHDPDGDVLIYSSAPFGQRASAAHLDASGRVARIEPLLDSAHFARIEVGKWNKEDVLTHFGRAAEFEGVRNFDVWSYRYRESGTWDSLFHVMFDKDGIVRQVQNGPDPMFDPSALRIP